ncbi:MAG: hypothetical protein IT448_09425 [Phycisphaerales bacterium]|nr:hypothetical protein [Phycisphaerales bacterium]
MLKTLDQKLQRIHADPTGSKDFILADAKDADMAAGMAAPGVDARTRKMRSLAEYRQLMRDVVKQGLVDIMLMSASSSEQLTIQERLFDSSAVTPACRANDTTDIHLMTGGIAPTEPSRPFRTATIDQIQSARVNPTPEQRRLGANLGLYSITPNNQVEFDYPMIEAYREFRIEAEIKGFRHFLEIFDPNACGEACPEDMGRYINDLVARTLGGVPRAGRPIFLKMVYHGPKALEELVTYDPHLVVGLLGGSSGTTLDAFKLLENGRKHGARAALFGRKINNSEDQLTFIRFLHTIASGQIGAVEATKAYHGELQKLGITPYRKLEDDLQETVTVSSYAGTSTTVVVKPGGADKAKADGVAIGNANLPTRADGTPDFSKMSLAQKVAYNRQRIARI